MELALGFHAANNLFTALLVTADWTAFQTHSVLKDLSDPQNAGISDVIIPVFVIFPIYFIFFPKNTIGFLGVNDYLEGFLHNFKKSLI